MRTLIALVALIGATSLGALLALRVADPEGVFAVLCGPSDGSSWTFDAWITVPLGLSAAMYLAGVTQVWTRAGIGRGILPGQVLAYLCGWLALAAALVSPLHRWGEGLFTAHMIEHELVMAVAAPLFALARPGAAFVWSLPRRLRRYLAVTLGSPPLRTGWKKVSSPMAAAVLHGLAIWAWHAPALFDAAVENVVLHRFQHLAFLFTALLFWWSSLRRSPGAAAGGVVLTMLHMSLLGALLALAPRVLYPGQTATASAWGLTPLEDQQLAGLVMWVPAGTVYAGVALWLVARWIRSSGAGWEARHAVPSA